MQGKVLITGGAGYIGSHAVRLFLQKGYQVAVFDNLSRGFAQAIEQLRSLGPIEFIQGDLRDRQAIDAALERVQPESVLHFAALCSVDESTKKPELYFQNNVAGTANLLSAMHQYQVNKIIFSSTCAIYGATDELPLKEDTPAEPVNAYGLSKLLVEKMLQMEAAWTDLRYVVFRYFNVCGAASDGTIGDSKHPSVHLMQNAVRGAMGLEPFYFTFQNMPTPDGSPIRDYIDVEDLVRAHYMADEYLKNGGKSDTFNLGNGTGYSVREIVGAVEKAFGIEFEKKEAGDKRQGENPAAYTDPGHVREVLGWRPEKTLQDSIASLRQWYQSRPGGWEK